MFGGTSARTFAVASIGSGSVSVGIADYKGRALTLLASGYRALPLEAREPAHAAATLKQELAQAAQNVLAQLAGVRKTPQIDGVYCVLRAPWTSGEVAHADASFEHDEYITEAIVSRLAREVLSKVSDRARFLDASVSQVLLNGYPTKVPEGKRARTVEITALISNADLPMRETAIHALAGVFPAQKPILRSGTRAIVEALSLARPGLRDCLVLDVAQEGTAALIVRAGAPEKEAYLTEGMQSMLQRAVPKSKPEETLSALRMLAHEECSDGACIAVQEGFAKMEPDLAHAFGEFFAKLMVPRRLPNELLLVAHQDIAPWLTRFFARIDFTQFTETAQPFAPTTLTLSELAVRIAQKNAAPPEIHLSIALALINKELFSD